MKSHTLPLFCGVATAVMCAAGISHWWSVHQLLVVMDGAAHTLSPKMQPIAQVVPEPATKTAAVSKATTIVKTVAAAPPEQQQKFYESLITRMESLQNQNRDLLDQLAETNRDLMKLEFRVDSHSASFRPLPVTDDQPFTSLDSDIGVLPPRAEPVLLPNQE